MAELCLMASSHSYPPDLGAVFHSEQGFNRVSKDFNHFLPCHGSNQDRVNTLSFNSSPMQKEEWKSTGGLLDCNHFVRIDSTFKRPSLIDVQGTHPDLVPFSFGIAEQCIRQEKILKLLASGSIEVEGGSLDLSMLYDLMGPQPPIADFPPCASYSRWCFNDAEPQQSLIYPSKELYFNEPLVELVGDCCSCIESTYHLDGQLQYNCSRTEMNDIFSVISDLYPKNTNKSSKQTMLVPYFERRRRASANTNASKLTTEKVGLLKSHEKVKEKTSQKKKTLTRTLTRTSKERDNSYLHACEILLSILVDKRQQGRNTIYSLKKSGPQLPQLLTQFSASIAGTAIAVILSVVCRVACGRVPFCASKLLSTGLGLGLISLSWAVNNLRDTIVSINKTSGKLGGKEEEIMNHLERNLKDIYFRVAALMAVAVLRLA